MSATDVTADFAYGTPNGGWVLRTEKVDEFNRLFNLCGNPPEKSLKRLREDRWDRTSSDGTHRLAATGKWDDSEFSKLLVEMIKEGKKK